MPFGRDDAERTPKVYSRDETAIISQLKAMSSNENKSEAAEKFNSMIAETAREDRMLKQQIVKVSNKPILRQRFVHLYVSGVYNNREIARILCISPNTITRLLRNPEIIEMIQAYQEAEKSVVDSALKSLRIKAVETQSELLDSQSDMVRFNTAKDILDRTGHKAEEKKTVNVNHTYEQRLSDLLDNVEIQDVPYVINDEPEINNAEGDAINGDDV